MVATALSAFSADDMMNGNFQERLSAQMGPSPTTVGSLGLHHLTDASLPMALQQQQQQQQQQQPPPRNGKSSATSTSTSLPNDNITVDPSAPYSAMDVLCGTNNYNHPGNRRFRSIIDANLQRYVDAPARADKTKVVCAVLEEILSTAPCVFLKQDSKTKQWHELDKQACKTKVGHALRVKSRFLPKSKDNHQHHTSGAPGLGVGLHANRSGMLHLMGAIPSNNGIDSHGTESNTNDANSNHHGTPTMPHTQVPMSHHHLSGMQGQPMNNNHNSIGNNGNPSRLLNMFLQDDNALKKPLHPQQYQYQYTTENAKLMMSNELQGLLGNMPQLPYQQQPYPYYSNSDAQSNNNNNDDDDVLDLPSLHQNNNNNNNNNLSSTTTGVPPSFLLDEDDDMASQASSNDSDFLERINELPLSHFSALDVLGIQDGDDANNDDEEEEEDMMTIGGDDDDDDDDDEPNVRGEELIQMLDFATAL